MMIGLLEVEERVRTAQRMDDKEWGLTLFKKLQGLTARHNLKQEGPERFYEAEYSLELVVGVLWVSR